MSQKSSNIILVSINTVTLLATLAVNALANIVPINGFQTGDISNSIPNLFVPYAPTFAIWALIYVALIISVIYQWMIVNNQEKRHHIEVLGLYFSFANILNALWIISWHYLRIVTSLIIMLLLLYFLILLYVRVHKLEGPLSYNITIRFPISLYLGWITIATAANVTTLLVSIGWNNFGLAPYIWAIGLITVATIINILVAFIWKDIWFPLVGIWSLFGIYQKRMIESNHINTMVALAALIGLVFIAFSVVITLIIKGRKVANELD
jgi:hypothetical protein